VLFFAHGCDPACECFEFLWGWGLFVCLVKETGVWVDADDFARDTLRHALDESKAESHHAVSIPV
jgi:hypothetical protein